MGTFCILIIRCYFFVLCYFDVLYLSEEWFYHESNPKVHEAPNERQWVLHIDNKRMPIIQETPVSPFPNDAKFGISWRLQTPLDFTCTKLCICTGARLFLYILSSIAIQIKQVIINLSWMNQSLKTHALTTL